MFDMDERRGPREGQGRGSDDQSPRNPVVINASRLSASGIRTRNITVMTTMPPFGHFHRRPPQDDVEDQALRDPPPIDDVSGQFTQEELDRHIEEKFLSYVANSCGSNPNWRRLARKLGLDSPTVDRLQDENSENVREFVYRLMLVWKRRKPRSTVADLVHVLCHARMSDAAMELRKYFRSLQD